jgi:predicted aspartyl protease
MRVATMGRVVVRAKIENLFDLNEAEQGRLPREKVRTVEVDDALVDTGATFLSLPKRYIQHLGLRQTRIRRVRTAAGLRDVGMYDAARLTVQDRDCLVEVSELPDDCPVLVGQLALEAMDFVVDPVNQRVIGNPEHNGEWISDMF